MAIGQTDKVKLQFRKGLAADINTTATKNTAVEGEPHYATDTKQLYIFDGTDNKPLPSSEQDNTFTGQNTFESGIILKSPNATEYRLIVDDSGNLSTEVVV